MLIVMWRFLFTIWHRLEFVVGGGVSSKFPNTMTLRLISTTMGPSSHLIMFMDAMGLLVEIIAS